MFAPKIKICGMRDAANMREIAALKPDFFGLIFYPKSPRFVSFEQLEKLPLCPEIRRVGVFVNADENEVLRVNQAAGLSLIQLHGDESPAFCERLQNHGLQIIKAFAIDENFDGAILKNYETICDYFLFDTKTQDRGGSGKAFDWNILRRIESDKPFFLSGGIGADNFNEAINACAGLPLFALDINSRAESAPGIKSAEQLSFIIHHLSENTDHQQSTVEVSK